MDEENTQQDPIDPQEQILDQSPEGSTAEAIDDPDLVESEEDENRAQDSTD